MSAKVILTGQAQDVQVQDQVVVFSIVSGPSTQSPPRGLQLYGPVTYRVECSSRQWRRARYDDQDGTDLVIEGYMEPRRDETSGELYIAVVAQSMQSLLVQNAHKLEQLQEALQEARDAFKQAREAGASRAALEDKAAVLVKANESVESFRARHPELGARNIH